jgi:uncharacterized membrane protein YcaP (DUF421 family)
VPDAIVLKRDRDLEGRQLDIWIRRGLMGLVAAVPLLALFNVFGQRPDTHRFPWLRRVLDGHPIVLVEDGRVIERNLRRERLTLDDLAKQARANQLASLEDVRWAIFEPSGTISFIAKKQ